MKQPKIIKTKESVTFKFEDSRPVVINKSNTHKLVKVNKFIKAEDWKGLQDFLFPASGLKEFTKGKVLVKNGMIKFGKDSVPEVIGRRIIELKKTKQDWKHLILFWKNLKKNPSADSKRQLFNFLQANHFAFTSDGRFIGYKKVSTVGDNTLMDSHSKTIVNNIGSVIKMKREEVNPDPDQTCSHGLHVGAWQYVSSFEGDTIVEVLVNPKDVVAVPNDYNNQKMRVCEYEVYRKVLSERKEEVLFVKIVKKAKAKKKIKKVINS